MRIATPISFVLPIAILLAWSLPALSLDSEDVVRMLHEDIIRKFPAYNEQKQTKALAGCVDWDATTLSSVNVGHLYSYYSSEHSDRPVFVSRVMHAALNACDRLRKKHKSTCECVPIDKNNKSALKVPVKYQKVLLREINRPKGEKHVTAGTSGQFDGRWEGSMRCGNCPNCTGPLEKHVNIDIESSRFQLAPDASYMGAGVIDDDGNVEVKWEPHTYDWGYQSRKFFRFLGSYQGRSLVLFGKRGPRSCDITLSRVSSL